MRNIYTRYHICLMRVKSPVILESAKNNPAFSGFFFFVSRHRHSVCFYLVVGRIIPVF